ncbi:hypothetical protein EDB80DRAFT_704920 [Ilyonectria destructans]|nr:hypothetical protein EDB80DRAFT_704920 [Ilyonectria destructans]
MQGFLLFFSLAVSLIRLPRLRHYPQPKPSVPSPSFHTHTIWCRDSTVKRRSSNTPFHANHPTQTDRSFCLILEPL